MPAGEPMPVRALVGGEPSLGGQHDKLTFPRPGGQPAPDDLLGAAVRVHVGAVHQGSPGFGEPVELTERRCLVRLVAEGQRAERERGHRAAAAAEQAVFHQSSAKHPKAPGPKYPMLPWLSSMAPEWAAGFDDREGEFLEPRAQVSRFEVDFCTVAPLDNDQAVAETAATACPCPQGAETRHGWLRIGFVVLGAAAYQAVPDAVDRGAGQQRGHL